MLPHIHFISAILGSMILLILQWPWWQIILFSLAAFFIDVDHYLLYIFTKNDFSIKRAYKYFKTYRKSEKAREKLFIFHTIEFFIIIVVMIILFLHIFFPILLGFVLHTSLDIVGSLTNKEKRYKRAFSILLYKAKRVK